MSIRNRIGTWLSKSRRRKAATILVGIVATFFLLDLVFPVHTEISFATLVEARDGTVLHAFIARDRQWRMKAKLGEISPELKKAIVFKEDKHFYHHFGVNPVAVGRAFINNVFHLKRTSGASTITMQVARMLDPKPRTYFNKGIEMFRATQLEVHYSKEEILQLYLNLVPYGGNIQGVKAAALLYFNKMPDHLSLAEITALSIIPNRPNSLLMGRDNTLIIKQRNKWLYRFQKSGLFPQDIISDALQEPLTAYRHSAPCMVPQFAYRVRHAYPGRDEIATALDYKMQQKAESIVTNYISQFKLHNINNAAILIVDNKTHEIVTYIGSSDFKDGVHYGQVDGVSAVRSPGSTLKPLLYGLCMDRGFITPKTMIADVPINLHGYSPENYDRTFNGNVTAEYALSHSLNIPAVKLLEQESTNEYVNVLAKAGLNTIAKSKKKMGLSLILGGCGVRLDELVPLYSSFANNGVYYPVQFTRRDSALARRVDSVTGVRLLSPACNYVLTHILSGLHRPDLPNAYEQARDVPHIAWKTGTSYGRKDAWSIGYNQRYTIGVWVGNFSAMGVQELSGTSTATPLLFQVFNAVDHNSSNDWLEQPKELAFRLVCAETGKVPAGFCTNQVMDYYIPGVSASELCDHVKETWLSADEKYCYCTSCLPPNGYKTKMLPNIPPELVAFYERTNTPYFKLPSHNPACSRLFDGQAPVITSLTNGMTYLIENKEQQKLQLACNATGDVHKIYWYINNKFYAACGANEKMFFSADAPILKISCSDDKGRNTHIQIKVKFI